MDADEVDGTPAMMSMMGMAPGIMLRDSFNNSDRSQTDNNIDWVTKFNYQASNTINYYAGLARKTRSASYQEHYLWLPLEATGGLADGNTYTGNLNFDAEVTHEIELGLDYNTNKFSISPRVFYRKVKDYIRGTATTNMSATIFVNMINMMNSTSNNEPLEFNNVDTTIYGADLDWRYQINSNWSLSGIINYVRGKRDDTSDNLYRIAPTNTTIAINHQVSNWGSTFESVIYNKQKDVSETNREQETAGYSLFNARGYWQVSEGLRLGFGLNNITDKRYQDHLAGYNRVMGNPNIEQGERLYGYGRNAYIRANFQFLPSEKR
ncbi:MAG: iron complex outermembrane receptor protein [Pseudohongiellaceae bacterium]|jgi:iron complex outermembrane receptor protein